MNWLLLAAIGALAGFLSGLLGIGGGIIVVPGLRLVLPRFGVHGPETIKIAMATSTAVMVLTAISGAQGHLVNRAVDWTAVRRLAPGLAAGALAAPQLASVIRGELLLAVFTAFPLIAAWNILRGGRRTAKLALLPKAPELSAKGFGMGLICTLAGMGISPFSVPLLSAHMALPRAIATTAALLVPMTAIGAIGFLLAQEPACAMGCAGYVHLTGAGTIATVSILIAPLGAQVTHLLPARRLRQVFAATLLILAASLIWKQLPDRLPGGTHDVEAAQIPGWLTPPVIAPSGPPQKVVHNPPAAGTGGFLGE